MQVKKKQGSYCSPRLSQWLHSKTVLWVVVHKALKMPPKKPHICSTARLRKWDKTSKANSEKIPPERECTCLCLCVLKRRRIKNGCALTWEEWCAILSAWAQWHRPCCRTGRVGGWGGGVSYGDNLSQVTLMEGGKALHSACEWAAAGPDAHNNSI